MSYDDFKSPKTTTTEIVSPNLRGEQTKRKLSESKERWELYSLKYVLKIILYPFTVMIRPRKKVRNL